MEKIIDSDGKERMRCNLLDLERQPEKMDFDEGNLVFVHLFCPDQNYLYFIFFL